jgi:hypothetical protein
LITVTGTTCIPEKLGDELPAASVSKGPTDTVRIDVFPKPVKPSLSTKPIVMTNKFVLSVNPVTELWVS